MKKEIINYSNLIGIAKVYFTNAMPFLKYRDFILDKHKNYAVYLEPSYNKEKNDNSWYDPSYYMEDAKTIISIVYPYNIMVNTKRMQKNSCKISKASIFTDYHKLVNIQLDELMQFLQNNYGARCISYCDTGPLNDKAVLLRTGEFTIGRNSLLFHKEFGSQFYIGYIITNIDIGNELEVFDEDVITYYNEYCKDCNLCETYCPNGAIGEDFGHINSNNCISFLTQSKEWALEDNCDFKLKGYVYGCDICQRVCPLNKNIDKKYIKESVVSEFLIKESIESMTNREFRSYYNKSSAGWIGKKRFLRNIRYNEKSSK